MRNLLVSVAVPLLALAPRVAAQQSYQLIAEIPRERREAVTLSRKDVDKEGCRIQFSKGVPPFASYISQSKMRSLIDAEKSEAGNGYILFSVTIDPPGIVSSRVLETTLKSHQVKRLSSEINSAIDGRPDTAAIHFRLRLDPGATDEPLRLGYSVTCPPQWMNPNSVVRAVVAEINRQKILPRGSGKAVSANAYIFVNDHGFPSKAHVVESSGDSIYNGYFLTAMLKVARFTPGYIDGLRSGMWTEVPLRFADRPDVH